MTSNRTVGLWFALALLGACGEAPEPPTTTARRDAGPPPECRGVMPGQIVCEGTSALSCNEGGQVETRTDCSSEGALCVPGQGCALCVPGSIRCDGETVLRCNADGSAESRDETCDAASGERCSPGGCARLCERAEAERSYLGCEYVAVTTSNDTLDPVFSFAIVVANPQLVPATVRVTRADGFSQTESVAAGSLAVITLPWVEPLRRPVLTAAGRDSFHSARVEAGSYRVRADVPVTVHQFNPLSYLALRDCLDGFDATPGDSRCNSYTNDASLLLPVHALTGSYLAMSRASHIVVTTRGTSGSPGFIAIVNTEDSEATVTVRPRAFVAASLDGSIEARGPGEELTLTLAPGEVVQLVSSIPDTCPSLLEPDPASTEVSYCPLGPDYDLTGTEIRSDHRLAVFGGHNCTFVPYDKWACDHLEEQLFPAESLGTSAVAPVGFRLRSEPNLLRIVSASDDNTVVFSPVPDGGGPETVVLDRGGFVEVTISRPTRVTGTAPILAARFFVGQNYEGLGSAGSSASGDPSMGLLVPDAQWRNQYVFLAPDTYSSTYVDVIAAVGARVELDGQVLILREAMGTGVTTATLPIDPGVHRIRASLPVGAHVYGFGSYTSYLVPAGLDLREIADPF
jgi:hypothetical protein